MHASYPLITPFTTAPTLVHVLQRDTRALRDLTSHIRKETGPLRHLRRLAGQPSNLGRLLDLELFLYASIRRCLDHQTAGFERCRRDLTTYLTNATNALDDLATTPDELPPRRDETRFTLHDRIAEADADARIARRHLTHDMYAVKIQDVEALLALTIDLHHLFQHTTEVISHEEAYLHATIRTFKHLLVLQPLGKVIGTLTDNIHRITTTAYDTVHQGVTTIDRALSGVTLPPFAPYWR